MLNTEEIQYLLECMAWRTLYLNGHIRLQEKELGYSSDTEVGRLQVKLSIMLEAAHNREARG